MPHSACTGERDERNHSDRFAIARFAHRAGRDCASSVSCGARWLWTLHNLAYLAIIPAAILRVLAWALLRKSPAPGLGALIRDGAVAGALATVALEAVRYSGFRFGFMPGNLTGLVGVLLFDRFALGPTAASTLGRFAYHFWNGACFGIIFALGRFNFAGVVGDSLRAAVGVGFLVSPVIQGLVLGIPASTLDGTSRPQSSQPSLLSVWRWPCCLATAESLRRNPVSVLWRASVLSNIPQNVAARNSASGAHSRNVQENFSKR
jgi:hypothetical protein